MGDIIDELGIFPPMNDTCPECACRHDPSQPHNRNSLYYQLVFYRRTGFMPSWADAMSHCSEQTQDACRKKLKESDIPIGMAFDPATA